VPGNAYLLPASDEQCRIDRLLKNIARRPESNPRHARKPPETATLPQNAALLPLAGEPAVLTWLTPCVLVMLCPLGVTSDIVLSVILMVPEGELA